MLVAEGFAPAEVGVEDLGDAFFQRGAVGNFCRLVGEAERTVHHLGQRIALSRQQQAQHDDAERVQVEGRAQRR